MKNLVILLIVIVIALFAMNTLSKKSTNNTTQPELIEVIQQDIQLDNGSYELSQETTVAWQGRRPLMQGYMDSGVLTISEGSIEVLDNSIASGHFVFDMNSITAQTTGAGGGEDMLSNHLKSDDFFSVEDYPTAELHITEITNGVLDGKLTLKGQTHPVQFPAVIATDGQSVRIIGTADLDRTLWNIQYGSGKFFDNLADKVIDDIFTVSFDVSLTQK